MGGGVELFQRSRKTPEVLCRNKGGIVKAPFLVSAFYKLGKKIARTRTGMKKYSKIVEKAQSGILWFSRCSCK